MSGAVLFYKHINKLTIVLRLVRIVEVENELKIKGVRSAVWDIDSKMLLLTYNPAILSLLKVHKLIAGVGHDTELEKAKEQVLNVL